MDGSLNDRERMIMGIAASHFGKDVIRVEALKQSPHSSMRVWFSDGSVIASQRHNYRRTHLEAMVLEQLSPICDDVPTFLGLSDGFLFQSDIGHARLGDEILEHDAADRIELAAEACASIFRIQSAARQSGVVQLVPKIGTSQEWMENLVGSVDALQLFSGGIPDSFDFQAVADRLTVQKWDFVKWHCRPSYAVISDDGFLRWNGFDLSGSRHGAEDLAWLIGDEEWPIAPHDMLDIVKQTFDPHNGIDWDQYHEYLAVYTTLHCVQRFKLIIRGAQEHGWYCDQSMARKDSPGVDPNFARQLCQVGAFFADQSKLTQPLVRNFERTSFVIDAINQSDLRA